MKSVKKSISNANKYTKKKNKTIYNNSKILHNFYGLLLKKYENLDYRLNYNNTIMGNILHVLYNEFSNERKIINAINVEKSRSHEDNKTNIKKKITPIVEKHLRPTKYIDETIINYIITNVNCKIVTYENVIKGKSYVFDFIIYDDKISIKKLDLVVENMLLFLQVLIAISNNELRNGQHVTFFLTPFQKKLNSDDYIILGAKNVNSGFTYPNLESGITFIYRMEEFFKVFVHESIHYYGIDKALHKEFNNNTNYNNFIDLFSISNKNSNAIGINEAVTEFWTFILYLCVISHKKGINYSDFVYKFERLYKLELIHVIFQLVKILNYNKLTYNQFISKSNTHYNESSHIFSYYIVKTLLVYNHEELLKSNIFEFIANSPKKLNISLKHDINTINKFFAILSKYALDPNFIKLVNKISIFYNSKNAYALTYKERFICNNLRMMASDYIIL
jgi:hypothetical protein